MGYHATDPKIQTQGAERGRSWIATKHGDGSLEIPGGTFPLARAGTRQAARRTGNGSSNDVVLTETAEDLGALVVVKIVALDKAPAIDVDHVTLASDAKKVKPANVLLERHRDRGGHLDLLVAEFGDVANLFAVWIALDDAVDDG